MAIEQKRISTILKKYEEDLASDWFKELKLSGSGKESRMSERELFAQAKEFIRLLQQATQVDGIAERRSAELTAIESFLDGISGSRVLQGFTADETATFVFSFKKPLFGRLRAEFGQEPQVLADEIWLATQLLDQMGLHTVRAFQKSREDVIRRQQEELLELSTPVVKLWEGVLALPMIGTLDSARTQVVMETLLQKIVETGSGIAIIDITGVPTVDTLVAQHLLKTVTAIRLMGADCIISGISPKTSECGRPSRAARASDAATEYLCVS
ncbi:MAG TPA: STAS domain-containing protein [Planctomycetota bacterium]|nr:STAS domain-containing protein [Planctomycetota bacterium]